MVRFRKLRSGSWGVSGPAGEVVVGSVQAVRRDGTVQDVTVYRVIWTDGVKAIGALTPDRGKPITPATPSCSICGGSCQGNCTAESAAIN